MSKTEAPRSDQKRVVQNVGKPDAPVLRFAIWLQLCYPKLSALRLLIFLMARALAARPLCHSLSGLVRPRLLTFDLWEFCGVRA
jgi:hypothetical protein